MWGKRPMAVCQDWQVEILDLRTRGPMEVY